MMTVRWPAAVMVLMASWVTPLAAASEQSPEQASERRGADSSEQAPSGQDSSEETLELQEITVIGVRRRLEQAGALTDAIMKTETVSQTTIQNLNAVNLSEAIRFSPGVNVSNECSMCGVKRIMLNGMKGEQTTILVDGLPIHTLISGFYAVDAIPTTGIERIEVARGAGASLTAPEAIGGTVNVVTLESYETGAQVDMNLPLNDAGLTRIGALGTWISGTGDTRITLVGQYDEHEQVDEDGNAVSEEPQLENRNLVFRISQDFGQRDNVTLRLGIVRSEIFGGPVLGETYADGVADSIGGVLSRFDGDGAEGFELFENGDVRQRFIGKAWETTEWIETDRDELTLSWLRELNENWNMTLATSYAEHQQDSFYEGFDYFAKDDMHFYSARFNGNLGASHLLTFGTDYRDEKMRSNSMAGSMNPDYTSDSFDYEVFGLFLQDTWTITDNLEAVLVLRNDNVTADFVDPNKPGVEIDRSIVSPRADIRWMHTDRWTSRLSFGRGWRAPLSFFETDHGILDGELGFIIDVDELERSRSATYALSFEGTRLTATGSVAFTEVENLAALDENEDGVPILTQLDEDASVLVADIALGYAVGDDLLLNFTAEIYDYDDAFQSSYNIAPIEERVVFNLDWRPGRWNLFANWVWIGSRDLSEYGYEGWNVANADGVVEAARKTTDAPSFYVMDARLAYNISQRFSVYVGANNLLDHRQVVDEDSPLFFDDGAGYDVAYIYGPLRGREAYAGLLATF